MIVGIAIPSCIAILGSLLTYKYINDVISRQNFVQSANDIRGHVLDVRRNEKTFLHMKNAEYFRNLDSSLSVLANAVGRIPPESVEEMGKEDFILLNRTIKTYSGIAELLNANYHEETAAAKTVTEEGSRLESLVPAVRHASELTEHFILDLRLIEKNYMFLRDKTSLDALKDMLSQLRNVTPVCYQCFPYIDSVQRLFAVFGKSDLLEKDLLATGNEAERITERIVSRENQKIVTFLHSAKYLLLAALALLFILGPLFVYKTADYITAPINRLTHIAQRIASGDLSLRAPMEERDETNILASSFNSMIDRLTSSGQSLQSAASLLEKKEEQLRELEKLSPLGRSASDAVARVSRPLNSLYLDSFHLVREMSDAPYQESARQTARNIFMNALRARKEINDMIEIASPKSAEFQKTNIAAVIGNTLKTLRSAGMLSGINTEMHIPDTLETLADELLLEQVFLNLLLNAVDRIEETGTMTIGMNRFGPLIKISISDTGKELPADSIPHIFEPYYTAGANGPGLGLSAANSIIGKHNGTIEVASEPGRGTTFTITLPC